MVQGSVIFTALKLSHLFDGSIHLENENIYFVETQKLKLIELFYITTGEKYRDNVIKNDCDIAIFAFRQEFVVSEWEKATDDELDFIRQANKTGSLKQFVAYKMCLAVTAAYNLNRYEICENKTDLL